MIAKCVDFIALLGHTTFDRPNTACWVFVGFVGTPPPSPLGITAQMAC
jgi:hypothetical protein